MSTLTVERAIELVQRQTRLFEKMFYIKGDLKVAKSKWTERDISIVKLCSQLPGSTQMRELVEIILNRELPPFAVLGESSVARVNFSYNILVYAIGNSNHHDYPFNVPLINTSGTSGFGYISGDDHLEYGNELTRQRDELRPATNDEIEEFVTDYYRLIEGHISPTPPKIVN